jgi:endonuclease/exonuclease/phosphatase family metal-dependent hydrolase
MEWQYISNTVLSATCISGIELLITILDNANVCFIYCPPNCATKKNFVDVMQYLQLAINIDKPTILMGDFNQNALQNSSISDLLLRRFSFYQLVQSITTDYDSCLDHIYINFPKDHLHLYGTLESYYSDHKPIFVSLTGFD